MCTSTLQTEIYQGQIKSNIYLQSRQLSRFSGILQNKSNQLRWQMLNRMDSRCGQARNTYRELFEKVYYKTIPCFLKSRQLWKIHRDKITQFFTPCKILSLLRKLRLFLKVAGWIVGPWNNFWGKIFLYFSWFLWDLK